MMAMPTRLRIRATGVADQYKRAVFISDLVGLFTACHCTRISSSWMEGCRYADQLEGVAAC